MTLESSITNNNGNKTRFFIFWPLLYWLLGGGLTVVGWWLGPWKHIVARVWLYPFFFGVLGLTSMPVLVLGRDSVWLGYLCGLYWKRIRRQNIMAVIDFYPRSGSPWFYQGALFIRSSDDGLYELPTTTDRWKRRLAECLHERYGVKIDSQPMLPYHQLK